MSICMPNLKFLASVVLEIRRGSQNFKSGLRDPFPTPFDLILHFSNVPLCWICLWNLTWISSLATNIMADLWLCRFGCEMPTLVVSPILGRFWGGFWLHKYSRILLRPQKAREEESKKDRVAYLSHICSDHPCCATATKVVMWGGVPDRVNDAKFHHNWFSAFRSLRGRNLPFSYA